METIWAINLELDNRNASIHDNCVYLANVDNHLIKVDLESGDILWECTFKSEYKISAQVPVISSNIVIATWEDSVTGHCINSGELCWEIKDSKGKSLNLPDFLASSEYDYYYVLFYNERSIFYSSYSGQIRKLDLMTGSVSLIEKSSCRNFWGKISNNLFLKKAYPNAGVFLYEYSNTGFSLIKKLEIEGNARPVCFSSDNIIFLQYDHDILLLNQEAYEVITKFTLEDCLLRDVYSFAEGVCIITDYVFQKLDESLNLIWEKEYFNLVDTCCVDSGIVFYDNDEGLNSVDQNGDVTKLREPVDIVYKLISNHNKILLIKKNELELIHL